MDPQQTNPIPEIPRPVFVSGKVLLEDGTPPPDLVRIERDCGGVVRLEGYTDSKGRFSFQVGQNPMAFMDASTGGYDPFSAPRSSASSSTNRMNLPRDSALEGCEIRAAFPGYRSDAIRLIGHRYMDNPEIGTIVLRRNGKVEGRDAARKSKWEEASKQLQIAVGLYPKYAIAWSELGSTLEQLKDVDGARNAYQQAVAADPKFVNPYLQLARIDLDRQQWQSAADTSSRAIKLDPVNFPGAYAYNSLAEFNLKHLDAAEASAREALKLDTSHSFPLSDRIMAAISTVKGDLTAAAQYLRSYLQSAPSARDAAMVRQQLQQLELRP
jgi:tetratricopeptide (TPR) repeat protein